MKYEKAIKKLLSKTVGNTVSEKLISADIGLQNYGIDSVDFVCLIDAIESKYHVCFPDEYLTQNRSGSVRALCDTLIILKKDRVKTRFGGVLSFRN